MCSCTKCCSFMAACSTSCVAHVLFYFCSSAAHVFVMCVHVPSACTSCVALVCFLTTLPTTWGPYSELCILCHAPSRSGWTMARAAASRRCSPPPRAAARWTPTAAAEAAGSGKRLAATPREARVLAKPALGGAAEWQERGRGRGPDLLQEPLPIMEFGQFHRLYTRARFLDSSVCAIFRGHLSSPLCVTRCPAQWHNHHCHFLPFGRLLRLSISNFGAPGFLQCVQFRTCFAFP